MSDIEHCWMKTFLMFDIEHNAGVIRLRLTCRRAYDAWIMGANPCYTSAP